MNNKHKDPFYETEEVASFTECTGLMPSLPGTEDENGNYASLYGVHKGRKSENDRKAAEIRRLHGIDAEK